MQIIILKPILLILLHFFCRLIFKDCSFYDINWVSQFRVNVPRKSDHLTHFPPRVALIKIFFVQVQCWHTSKRKFRSLSMVLWRCYNDSLCIMISALGNMLAVKLQLNQYTVFVAGRLSACILWWILFDQRNNRNGTQDGQATYKIPFY